MIGTTFRVEFTSKTEDSIPNRVHSLGGGVCQWGKYTPSHATLPGGINYLDGVKCIQCSFRNCKEIE